MLPSVHSVPKLKYYLEIKLKYLEITEPFRKLDMPRNRVTLRTFRKRDGENSTEGA